MWFRGELDGVTVTLPDEIAVLRPSRFVVLNCPPAFDFAANAVEHDLKLEPSGPSGRVTGRPHTDRTGLDS
jgi:hypothetical protein